MTQPLGAWEELLHALAKELPPLVFEAWLDPLVAESVQSGIRILCPSAFHRERVRDRFLATLTTQLRTQLGEDLEVTLAVDPGARPRAHRQAKPPPEALAAPEPGPRRAPPRELPARVTPSRQVALLPHTFETFIVGPANALAREASVAVAEGRQLAMSPLCLVGASGMGKSHLAHAIAQTARDRNGEHVRLVSAEQFTNEITGSIRNRRTAEFKTRYREEVDVLVLEDVDFLQGKRATQLELFHTLEWLERRGRRVVFTASHLPREIPDLDPRLASRMAAGLCAELEAPDPVLRCAILRAKAAQGGVRLPDDCLERLAACSLASVRDLESVLIQLVASASLLGRPIDLHLTEAALRKVAPRRALLDPETVAQVVAAFFGTTPENLASASRRRDVLLPRQLAMYLSQRFTPASHQRIGKTFGRNHTAVANAIRAIERAILERAPLRYQVEALAGKLEEISGSA
jgi:chromosomal replication initiator protein